MGFKYLNAELVHDVLSTNNLHRKEDEEVSTERGRVIAWLRDQFEESVTTQKRPPLSICTSVKTILKDDATVFEQFKESTRIHLFKEGSYILDSITTSSAGIDDLFQWLDKTRNDLTIMMTTFVLSYEQQDSVVRLSRSMFQTILNEPVNRKKLFLVYQQQLTSESSLFDPERLQYYNKLLQMAGYQEEVDDLMVQVTRSIIQARVEMEYTGHWQAPALPSLLDWVEHQVYRRLCLIQCTPNLTLECLESMSKNELALVRTKECFDIVNSYPGSTSALEEIRICLKTTQQREKLIYTFISACDKRLLHSGANTVDVVSFYISTIRSFLIIDHRAVLLDKVCRPIRRYLKEREDTIQKIVFAMLDETEDNSLIDLANELRKGGEQNLSVDDFANDLNWVPDPIDALPDFRKGVVSDIIESLISLFDSKDIFMGEFVNVFADKLLKLTDYDTSDIMLKLELLKLKFGDSEFSSLDVMLKDFADSKATDSAIHKETDVDPQFHSSILSHLYWPALDKETFSLPSYATAEADKYAEAFTLSRKGRKLKMVPSLGTVSIDVEFADRTETYIVTPDKVAVLDLFQSPKGLQLEDVCGSLNMSDSLARRNIVYWLKAGVLQETPSGVFRVVENQEDTQRRAGASMADNHLIDDTPDDSSVNAMESYLPFILGMLTNLGATPIPKMHSFLQMLVPKDNPYTATQSQLEAYLSTLVDEDKLELVNGGSYKLKK
ncbi:unnamed protein product [Kuraishia capsulata CBS 1993]|uniref:Anaphase-promoting complex subunit 2 n=1 Tax=Kuraishia capsulata CBS 1993 TaxID=1382522 RepID=W6MXH0_9ASCO|nr:uncharacterized protein KUCA_T00004860001 [Kuraishia capsulata CBS 1993]CDK28875.1 unnamed protein product [Kuraishia capsulata CBS 1993]